MAKYIFQLRRGTKNDWAEYEDQPGHIAPLEGELVLEYDNGVPRLKIGDGVHEFSQLEYMSVDSFILPKQPKTITLYQNGWALVDGTDDTYEQDVSEQVVDLITDNSKIDLQPTPLQLYALGTQNIALTAVNENKVVKVYAVGAEPEIDYEDIFITVQEVICDG